MNVLVAGGAGMVGSHLVDALIARGDRVTVVDNFLTGSSRNLAHLRDNRLLALVNADITEPFDNGVLRDDLLDRIYHLASPASPVAYARDPIATLMVNAQGTRHLLELARAHEARFLLASTSEVYGDPLVVPQPESYWGNVNPIGPRASYDQGKRFAESLTMTYHRVHELDIRIARIFNAYGPRSAVDDGRVIPNFCVQALQGKPLTIYGDGGQTRSFCYIADLIGGLIALMDVDGLNGEVINLGNPDEQTIATIAAEVVATAGSKSPIVYLPLPIDDPAQRRPDIAKARELLRWEPQIDFQIGLRPTLEYFRNALTNREI
jgi:nucleoside-diphosphate-sugar epimerase